jgi:hypothetical protein
VAGQPHGETADIGRRRRVFAILCATPDVDPDRRTAFVAARCGGDRGLAADVDTLLADRIITRAGRIGSPPTASSDPVARVTSARACR